MKPFSPDSAIDHLLLIETSCFDRPYSKQQLETEFQNRQSTFLGITVDGAVLELEHGGTPVPLCGYALFYTLADRSVELFRIAILPDARRRGLAGRLLDEIRLRATDLKHKKIFLEVSQNNHGACALYEKRGFETVSRRKAYYADRSDALIMILSLK